MQIARNITDDSPADLNIGLTRVTANVGLLAKFEHYIRNNA